jgi:hypothetical protein
MSDASAANPELISQLRGVVTDLMDSRPNRGKVANIYSQSIDVRLADSTLLQRVTVVGGSNGLAEGDTVYLMYFGQSVVAMSTRGFSAGQPIAGTSVHLHDSRYYTKGQVSVLLDGKADLGHTHAPLEIHAEHGWIGGWVIDSAKIANDNVYLASAGYLALGDTPPSVFGSNVGVWLGWSTTTANDAGGAATSANKPKLSMYADANNWLQWTGTKLLVKAANFTLDGSGNITASNVTLSGAITATSGVISLMSVLGILTVGANEPLIRIDGNSKFIGTSDFVSGLSGWRIDTTQAEFENIVARGQLRASVYVVDEVHAVGGELIVRSASVLHSPATTG